MKTYSKLWMLQGSVEEMVNQLNRAKDANDWEKVEAIAKVLSNKLSLIDEIANICYDKNI